MRCCWRDRIDTVATRPVLASAARNYSFLDGLPSCRVDDVHRATKCFVDRIAALALERLFSDIASEYGSSEHGDQTTVAPIHPSIRI